MKNTREACDILGIDRNRLKRIRERYNIETTRGMREGIKSTMTFISDANIELIKEILIQEKLVRTKKPKKEEIKSVKKGNKSLEFFRVNKSNIYRVYEVVEGMPTFLGTCTEEKYYEFKNKFKGVK